RVDVVVTGGNDEGVLPVATPDQLGDGGGPVRAALHRNAAALAEVLLHIDDDQCTAHGKALPSDEPLPDGRPCAGRRACHSPVVHPTGAARTATRCSAPS